MQADYIFFVYGLAFFYVGAVCLSMDAARNDPVPWTLLGLFGLSHGLNEWADMAALSAGDSAVFALSRLLLMTLSFTILFEFGRRGLKRLGGPAVPGWLVLPPLLGLVAGAGFALGLPAANGLARYLLALPGCLATALVLVWWARQARVGEQPWLRRAALVFVCYGVATGVVVPASPLPPAGLINQDAFLAAAGFPIQLVRGALAVLAAMALWAYDLERTETNGLMDKARRHFWLTTACLALVVALGCVFTNWMGRLYDSDLRAQVAADLTLLADRLTEDIREANGAAFAMAATGWDGRTAVASAAADTLVDRFHIATNDGLAYLLDRQGTAFAASNRAEGTSLLGQNYAFRPYFQDALAGRPGQYFAFGATTRQAGYYASRPVQAQTGGAVVAVAVIKQTLDAAALGFIRVGDAFLIDPHGVVLLAGRPELQLRNLWPLAPETTSALATSRQFGRLQDAPLLAREPANGEWLVLAGTRYLVGRQPVNDEGWSLLLLKKEKSAIVNRLFGTVITLLVSILILCHFILIRRELNEEFQLNQRQRRIEDLLAFNERLIAASDLGILAYHPAGDCLLANQAAARILGGPVEELKRQNFRALASWQEHGLLAAADRALASGRPQHLLARLVTCFGRDVWLECDLTAFASSGDDHLLVTVKDVSASKAAEDALCQARDQAEAAARARSVFLATMSHELRTPLSSIIGFGEMIASRQLEPPVLATAVDYARYIVSSGYHLLDIINRVLDCARIESGLMAIEPSTLDVRYTIAHAIREARRHVEWPRKAFALSVPRTLPPLWADRHAVYQILANLITNALTFSPPGGLVSLAGRVGADGGIELEITDSGVGIPKDQFARILKPFEQGDTGYARMAGGIGLGLFLVGSLVEMHGGRLRIDSAVGRGTSVTIWFPPPPPPKGAINP